MHIIVLAFQTGNNLQNILRKKFVIILFWEDLIQGRGRNMTGNGGFVDCFISYFISSINAQKYYSIFATSHCIGYQLCILKNDVFAISAHRKDTEGVKTSQL